MAESMNARTIHAVAAAALIAAGLAIRAFKSDVPLFVFDYGVATLWAALVYCAAGVLFPLWPISAKFAVALLLSYCIELSQLYHAPLIDAIRANRYAHPILGGAFVSSNLVCYIAGVSCAALVEKTLRRR